VCVRQRRRRIAPEEEAEVETVKMSVVVIVTRTIEDRPRRDLRGGGCDIIGVITMEAKPKEAVKFTAESY